MHVVCALIRVLHVTGYAKNIFVEVTIHGHIKVTADTQDFLRFLENI